MRLCLAYFCLSVCLSVQVRELDETIDAGIVCGFSVDLRARCDPGPRRARLVAVRVCADCGGGQSEWAARWAGQSASRLASRRGPPCIGSVVFARMVDGEGAHSAC